MPGPPIGDDRPVSPSAPAPRPYARPSGLTIAGILALVDVILFAPALGSAVFFERDIHWFWYPQVAAFVRAVGEHAWPLWNPYPAFGLPFLADPSNQVLYPPTWLNLLLPPAVYYKAFVLLHGLAAGAGTYALSRRWGLEVWPALIAAASWMCSGPLLSSASLYHHFAGAAWMPWVLWSFHGLLRRPTAAAGLTLGLAAGLQALAGSADMCFMTLILGVLSLSPRWRSWKRLGQPRLTLSLLLAAVVALAAAAGQWLPTADLLRQSSRLRLPPGMNVYWSLHPMSLLDLLVPGLVAELPINAYARQVLFESREPFLRILYLGAPAAAFVALSWLCPRTLGLRWAAGGFLFFLLLAHGGHTPLYPALLELPLFSVFRYPVKYLWPASLLWAILIGCGVQAWSSPWGATERRRAALSLGVVAVISIIITMLALWAIGAPEWVASFLTWQRRPEAASLVRPSLVKLAVAGSTCAAAGVLIEWRRRGALPSAGLTAVAVAVLMGDLLHAGRHVNLLAPPELLQYRTPLVQSLPPGPDELRLFVFHHPLPWLNAQIAGAPPGWRREWAEALGFQDMLWPPIGGRWRVWGSYDGDATGLAGPQLAGLTALVHEAARSPLAVKLLQMGNVGYVVSIGESPFPGLRRLTSRSSVFALPVQAFRVPDPVPRTYLVGRARVVAESKWLPAIADPLFDPRREIVLTSGSALIPSGDAAAGLSRVRWRRSDSIMIDVQATAPAYAVLVEAWAPGWRATLDGRPAEVLKANGLFRAIAVPVGAHEIELRYRPRAMAWGAGLSLTLAVVLLPLGMVQAWRRLPRRGGAARS